MKHSKWVFVGLICLAVVIAAALAGYALRETAMRRAAPAASGAVILAGSKSDAKVLLSAHDMELGLGEASRIEAFAASGGEGALTYVSSNPDIAHVDPISGEVVAMGVGVCEITAVFRDERSDPCAVTVLPAAQYVRAAESLSIGAKDSAQLVASLPAGTAGSLRYESSDKRVVQVSADGLVRGIREGSATITVSCYGGVVAVCDVQVLPAPTRVSLPRLGATIGLGESFTVAAELEPIGTMSALTFSSSDERIVAVDENGTVTGIKTGSATVTVRTYNGKSAALKVSVRRAPSAVVISREELYLGWDESIGFGEKFKLSAKISSKSSGGYEFFSSDPSVATVKPATGEVTATGIGRAEITVMTYNGRVDTCAVTVAAAPSKLRPANSDVILGQSQKYVLEPVLEDGISAVRYMSSNTDVVTVNSNGQLTARWLGEALVTMSTFNGKSALVRVSVLKAPSRLALAVSSATVGVGAQYQIVPVLSGGSAAGFTYTSANPNVATVDENGVVVGRKVGSTTITVKTYNDRINTFKVKVVRAPSSIGFSRTQLNLEVSETMSLKPVLSQNSSANITFTSSDESVATVDAAGRVVGVALGQCVITAETHNGLAAQCEIAVVQGPASISAPDQMLLGVGEVVIPQIEAYSASGGLYGGEYSLSSSNSKIVAVSGTSLRAVKRGTATITVRSHLATAQFTVRVVNYAALYPAKIYAHRGASAYTTGNTMQAFYLAGEQGADGIELDVRSTRDGHIVVFHDATVDSGGEKRNISDLTLAQIREIDLNGQGIPTLDEALEYIASAGMSLQLELKGTGIAARCVEAVQKYGMQERTIYIGFSLAELSDVKYYDPGAKLGYVFSTLSFDIEAVARQYELYAVLPRYAIVNEKLVDKVHGMGLKIGVWTVNEAELIATLAQMGVDFITTDVPDMALALLE